MKEVLKMKINFELHQIELTAKEMKYAQNYGSPEYYNLIHAMSDLPNFEVRTRHPRYIPNANRGLTYAFMEQHIALYAPELQETFILIRTHSGYPETSKWFRKAFPGVTPTSIDSSTLHIAA